MKMSLSFVLPVLFFSQFVSAQISSRVFYVELKEDQKINETPILEYRQSDIADADKKIVLYPEIQFQTIEGIGGAFNEIGGEALMKLPKMKRKRLMKNLFSRSEGCGFSFCRTAVGASDFGIDAYSYSEVANDFDMNHFSVDRERKSVIPYIQLAYKFNPELKMFASPWSPPGWMKYSGFMDRGVEFPEKNRLKNDPEVLKAYALYFTKYLKAYAENGIVINRLIIQNENDVHTKYPSCVIPPKQMGHFASQYLRPSFVANGIKTEIWGGTFRTANQIDAIEFVADEKLRESVDGIGIQYTKPRFISDMKALFPDVRMMHTEGNCFNGANSVEQAKTRLKEVASYINFGSPNYCYWNMILNETGKSGWDWKQNSLINIDRESKTVTYNPDYSVMALISKFLQPGAKRIAGFSRSELISVEKDGKVILFVQNDGNSADRYECKIGGEKSFVEVPGNSVAAIVLTIGGDQK